MKPKNHPPPEGKVRQSQLLGTYGAGAMVDLLNDAVLVGGLGLWRGGDSFDEPRLRARLLRAFPLLRSDAPFRLPPACDDSDPNQGRGVPVLELPHWFVCQRCQALAKLSAGATRRAKHYTHDCGPHAYFVPVRFVYACNRGHLTDFWWDGFVKHEDDCAARDLALTEGPTGDFGEVFVRCRTCKASRALMSAAGKDAGPPCGGRRPWLSDVDPEPCTEKMKLLQRTGSNAYFAQIASALSIPRARSARDAVAEIGLQLLGSATRETLSIFRGIPAIGPKIAPFSDDDVSDAIEEEKAGKPPPSGEIRTEEFEKIIAVPPEKLGELPSEKEADFFARTLVSREGLPKSVKRVVLASRLREVRVQTSFTRFEDLPPNMQGEYPLERMDLPVRPAPLARRVSWLPGVAVRGEGIFVQLDEGAVRAWEDRVTEKRGRALLAGHDAWRAGEDGKPKPGLPEFFGVRYYMLHSLAHLLIQAVSLSCGYSASSIRERIYCAGRDRPEPMAALLLSTGTTGAEGTLGGLLDEGRRLGEHPPACARARNALLERSGVRAARSVARPDGAPPSRCGLPRVPLHRRALVRAVQPVPRSRSGLFDTWARRPRLLSRARMKGLREVPSAELTSLREAIRAGVVPTPVTRPALDALGMRQLGDRAAIFAGLSQDAVLALLEAVLDERANPPPGIELVWSGPEGQAGWASGTAEVVRQLFDRAERNVLLAGYSFDHGEEILAPLHDAMTKRGTTADVYLHIETARRDVDDLDAYVQSEVGRFLSVEWPWIPKPAVFVDPRTAAAAKARHYASMHAKCIVVDERWALVGSANFTNRGQTRNIEVGALIDDPAFARAVVSQFRSATACGVFRLWLDDDSHGAK